MLDLGHLGLSRFLFDLMLTVHGVSGLAIYAMVTLARGFYFLEILEYCPRICENGIT